MKIKKKCLSELFSSIFLKKAKLTKNEKNLKNYLLANLRPKLTFWSQHYHRIIVKFIKKIKNFFFQHLN
jgi:hypothetical protein